MHTHLEIDTIKKVIQRHKLSEEIIEQGVDNHTVERPTSCNARETQKENFEEMNMGSDVNNLFLPLFNQKKKKNSPFPIGLGRYATKVRETKDRYKVICLINYKHTCVATT